MSSTVTSTISTTGPGPGATLFVRVEACVTVPDSRRPRLEVLGVTEGVTLLPESSRQEQKELAQYSHPNRARHRVRCLARTRRMCLATARSYLSHWSCSTMSSGRVSPTSTNPSVKPIAASSAARSIEWIL